MAHFAELNDSNEVVRVVVVKNEDTADASGTEQESIGIAHCQKLFGGRWVQTSYNGSFRHRYAGIGYTYDETNDVFLGPKPHASWTLDDDYDWQPPIPRPAEDGNNYIWDEDAYQADTADPKTIGWVVAPAE